MVSIVTLSAVFNLPCAVSVIVATSLGSANLILPLLGNF